MAKNVYETLAQDLLRDLGLPAPTEQQLATARSFLTERLGQLDVQLLRATPHQYTNETTITLHKALELMQRERRMVRQTTAMILLAGEQTAGNEYLTGEQARDLFKQRFGMPYTDTLDWQGYVQGEQMVDPAGIYLFYRGHAYRAFDLLPDPARPRLEGALDQVARWQAEKTAREYYESLHESDMKGPNGWDCTWEEMQGVQYNDEGYLIVGSVFSKITHYDPATMTWTVATNPYVGPELEPVKMYTVSRTPEQQWIVEAQ